MRVTRYWNLSLTHAQALMNTYGTQEAEWSKENVYEYKYVLVISFVH